MYSEGHEKYKNYDEFAPLYSFRSVLPIDDHRDVQNFVIQICNIKTEFPNVFQKNLHFFKDFFNFVPNVLPKQGARGKIPLPWGA